MNINEPTKVATVLSILGLAGALYAHLRSAKKGATAVEAQPGQLTPYKTDYSSSVLSIN
jgi:hypothetical protein